MKTLRTKAKKNIISISHGTTQTPHEQKATSWALHFLS